MRASLKILRTTNRWHLFRHSSQNSFAEDELCTRIFVARRMARTDRKIFSSLAARRIFRDALESKEETRTEGRLPFGAGVMIHTNFQSNFEQELVPKRTQWAGPHGEGHLFSVKQ
jgi:hypothetical protein